MYIYIYVYTYVYVYIYIYIYMYIFIYTSTHTYIHACLRACVRALLSSKAMTERYRTDQRAALFGSRGAKVAGARGSETIHYSSLLRGEFSY